MTIRSKNENVKSETLKGNVEDLKERVGDLRRERGIGKGAMLEKVKGKKEASEGNRVGGVPLDVSRAPWVGIVGS